jgi:hypothetical protein
MYIYMTTNFLPPTYIKCANEGEKCTSLGTVYFGKNNNFVKKKITGIINCDKNIFIPNKTNTVPIYSASSLFNNSDFLPKDAFDNNPNTFWHSAVLRYNTSGAYTGPESTNVDSIPQKGEWLQIQYPTQNILEKFLIVPRSGLPLRSPNNFIIAGSDDGIVWSKVFESINTLQYPATGNTFTVNNNKIPYNYYRLIIKSIFSSPHSDSVNIAEWNLTIKTITITDNNNTCYTGETNIIKCADIGQKCKSLGKLYFGSDDKYTVKYVSGAVNCNIPIKKITGTRNNTSVGNWDIYEYDNKLLVGRDNTNNIESYASIGGLKLHNKNDKLYIFPESYELPYIETTANWTDPNPGTIKSCYTSDVNDASININMDTFNKIYNLGIDYDKTSKLLNDKIKELDSSLSGFRELNIKYDLLIKLYDDQQIKNNQLQKESINKAQATLQKTKEQYDKEISELGQQILKLKQDIKTRNNEFEILMLQKEKEKLELLTRFTNDLDKQKKKAEQIANDLYVEMEALKKKTITEVTALFKTRENEYLDTINRIQKELNDYKVNQQIKSSNLLTELEKQKKETENKLQEVYKERQLYYENIINEIEKKTKMNLEKLQSENQANINKINAEYIKQIQEIENKKKSLENEYKNLNETFDKNQKELKKQINQMELMYEKKIANLEKELEKKNEEMKKNLLDLDHSFRKEVEELINNRNMVASNIMKETNKKIENYLNTYSNQTVQIDNTFLDQKKLLKQKLDNTIDNQTSEYKNKLQSIKSKNDEIFNELEIAKKKYKDTIDLNQKNLQNTIKKNENDMNELKYQYEKNKKQLEEEFMKLVRDLENKKISTVRKKEQETIESINILVKNVDTMKTNFEANRVKYEKELITLLNKLENDKISIIKKNVDQITNDLNILHKNYNNEKNELQNNIDIMIKNISSTNNNFNKLNNNYKDLEIRFNKSNDDLSKHIDNINHKYNTIAKDYNNKINILEETYKIAESEHNEKLDDLKILEKNIQKNKRLASFFFLGTLILIIIIIYIFHNKYK